MRIPSTSDLCQAHSNRAYDKMEVISDHIHELMDLYEWIFNLRAYLASLLAGYVTIGTDQTITGMKAISLQVTTMILTLLSLFILLLMMMTFLTKPDFISYLSREEILTLSSLLLMLTMIIQQSVLTI